jgi:hypothetical protein
VFDNLREYVTSGGQLIITARNLHRTLFGASLVDTNCQRFPGNTYVTIAGSSILEPYDFELCPIVFPNNATVLAKVGNIPAVVSIPVAGRSLLIFASPFGVTSVQTTTNIEDNIDEYLAEPFPLLSHVKYFLDKAFKGQSLFSVGDNLAFITNRVKEGQYVVTVSNPTLKQQPFKIQSNAGKILQITEIPMDQSEKTAIGYLPKVSLLH